MKFCLISCNIRFDNPADGVNAWPHRRDILALSLLKHRPDIIATQEGRYTQLKDFESLLSDFHIVDPHRSWIKERMYPTFFVRKDQFEVLRSEDLWLSETPEIAGSLSFGSTFPRLMTWVKLQPKNSKTNFFLVNTHLDHVKTETRINQIKVLAREIKRLWNENSLLFITGDFNDSPQSEVRKILIQEFSGLQDAWAIFNNIEETSHHAFNGECQNGSRIDWVMVDKRARVENCLMDKGQVNGRYPTDHFPIVCNFSF